jgi:hypothetical protein
MINGTLKINMHLTKHWCAPLKQSEKMTENSSLTSNITSSQQPRSTPKTCQSKKIYIKPSPKNNIQDNKPRQSSPSPQLVLNYPQGSFSLSSLQDLHHYQHCLNHHKLVQVKETLSHSQQMQNLPAHRQY